MAKNPIKWRIIVPISAEVTKQEKSSLKLDISIDAAEVDKAFDEYYKELVKKVKVKGFRPGKVPVGILRMKYGESISQDVLENLLNTSFRQIIQEKDLHPINSGSLAGELPALKEGENFAFSIEVDVYPEFELPEYKGLSITKNTYEVKDKDVDSEIQKMTERFAKMEDESDETPAGKDSVILFDFDLVFDGEIDEKMHRDGYSYDQGNPPAWPNLKKSLIGKKAGESLETKGSYPKEFPDKDRAGKDCMFKIDIKKIQKRELPEINDEFVQKISQDKTVADFKASMRTQMEEHAKHRESKNAQSDLIDQLMKKTTIDIPESMVKSETDAQIAQLNNTLMYSNMSYDQYLQETGKTDEQIREEFREPAVKQVTSLLILNEISKKEDVKTEGSEIDEEVEQLAKRYGQKFEDTKKNLAEHGELDNIAFGIRRRKTLEFLENEAKVKQGKTLSYTEIDN